MGLAELDPDLGLQQCAEARGGLAEEPGRHLGVEDVRGDDADLLHAGQVLARGVDDPRGVARRLHQGGQARLSALEGDGIDQPGACTLATDLQQIGLGPVPVPVCALSVEGDRSGGGGEGTQRFVEGLDGVYDGSQGFTARLDVVHTPRPVGRVAMPGGSCG